MKYPLHCPTLFLFKSDKNPNGIKFEYLVVVEHLLDTNRCFTATGTGIRAAMRISEALHATRPGERYAIEEADWKLLNEAAERPEQGYPRLPGQGPDGSARVVETGRHLVPFVNSIAEAPAERPVKSPEETESSRNGTASATSEA